MPATLCRKRLYQIALVLLFGCRFTTAANADLLLKESFVGYTPGNLSGQTVNAIGLTGQWTRFVHSGSPSQPQFVSTGLSFDSRYGFSGGAVTLTASSDNTTVGNNSGLGAQLSSYLASNQSVLWTSYLFRINGTPVGTDSHNEMRINKAINAVRNDAWFRSQATSAAGFVGAGYDTADQDTGVTVGTQKNVGDTTYLVIGRFTRVDDYLRDDYTGMATTYILTEAQFANMQDSGTFSEASLDSRGIGTGAGQIYARISDGPVTSGNYTYSGFLQLSTRCNSTVRTSTFDEIRHAQTLAGLLQTTPLTLPAPTTSRAPWSAPVGFALDRHKASFASEDTDYVPGVRETGYNSTLKLVRGKAFTPGYGTNLPEDSYAHFLMSSFTYALALLDTGEASRVARAEDVLRVLLPLQDVDPARSSYGMWPWHYEETIDQMTSLPNNTRDFNGQTLLQIAMDHKTRLAADVQTAIDTALGHCVESIRRSNIGPDYSNIAIKGAYVALIAGELYGRNDWRQYGRYRLGRLAKYTAWNFESFSEYNSYHYYLDGNLQDLTMLKADLRDPDPLPGAQVSTLLGYLWRDLYTHFHAPSRQWAGPHARTYSNLIKTSQLALIQRATAGRVDLGVNLNNLTVVRSIGDSMERRVPLDYPSAYDSVLTTLGATRTTTQFFDRANSTVGTTYLHPNFALGSVNRSDLWNQRHSLIAYFGTASAPGYAQLRFLKGTTADGLYDFSSAMLTASQREGLVVGAVNFITNGGDKHPSTDKVVNGTVAANAFLLRLEFGGTPGAAATISLSNGNKRATISADGRTYEFTLASALFGGNSDFILTTGGDSETKWVDVILSSSVVNQSINLGTIGNAVVGFVFSAGATPAVTQSVTSGKLKVACDGLAVLANVTPYAQSANPAAPVAPSGFTAAPTIGAVNLVWTDNASAEFGYAIELSTDAKATWTKLADVDANTTSFQHTGVGKGVVYNYRLRAVAAETDSASVEAAATTWTAQQAWRYQYFGTTANTGNAADSADPDADSLYNAAEYAADTDPTVFTLTPLEPFLLTTTTLNYTQTFDTLATSGSPFWLNDYTLRGWYSWTGGAAPATYTAADGSSANANKLLSVGSATVNPTDRALGAQTGGSPAPVLYLGLALKNATGATQTALRITYDAEVWRSNGQAGDGYTVQYQIFAAGGGSINAASGWTTVPALAFTNTLNGGAIALNGNSSANRTADIAANLTGLTWANGQELWIRWSDNTSLAQIMALDNVRAQLLIPASPAGLTATASAAGELTLAWTAGDAALTGYLLEYRVNGGGSWTTLTPAPASSATSYTHTGLAAGTTYDYRLSATNTYGSSGTVAASATTWTALQAWRVSNSLAVDGSGTAANTADPDGDGLKNLLEYALGGTPTDATSAPVPTAALLPAPSSTLTLTFFRALPASELTYTVQASSDLTAWSDLAVNPGTVGQDITVTDSPPAGASRRFLRLKVAAP